MTAWRKFAALAALGLALSACRDETPPPEPAIRPVLSTIAVRRTEETLVFAGSIEPRYQAELGFPSLGRIVERAVGVGDRVGSGQILAALDPAAPQQVVRSAQADLDAATAQFENATATNRRRQELVKRNAVSSADADAARQILETTASSVDRARANLAKARDQLDHARLRATFDGVVISVDAEVGQVVAPSQTVLTVARTDDLEAVVDVPLAVAADIAAGSPFDVALPMANVVPLRGLVREIAPTVDAATRTRRVRIALGRSGVEFRIGTTITASWNRSVEPRVELPVSALFEDHGSTRVWVVDPASHTVSARAVTVAGRDDRFFRVTAGLIGGERVVTAGVHSLSDGKTVALAQEALR